MIRDLIDSLIWIFCEPPIYRRGTLREIDKIIVHCSATPEKMNIGVKEIRDWHVMERGWSDIGYHDVIRRDGSIEEGRPIDKAGAHVKGHNKNSIGICLVGGVNDFGAAHDNFTKKQMRSLGRLLRVYKVQYTKATIHGHREFANKSCPSFDVQKFIRKENI